MGNAHDRTSTAFAPPEAETEWAGGDRLGGVWGRGACRVPWRRLCVVCARGSGMVEVKDAGGTTSGATQLCSYYYETGYIDRYHARPDTHTASGS